MTFWTKIPGRLSIVLGRRTFVCLLDVAEGTDIKVSELNELIKETA